MLAFRSLTGMVRFTEWAKIYGGIFSLKLGPGTAIVLTDRRIVRELLDKQSSISSYRPVSYLSQKLITSGDHILVMDYGQKWRSMRKLIHQEFTESLCEKRYIKIVNAEGAQMLRDMVADPENFMQHPRRFSNSIVMSIGTKAILPSLKNMVMRDHANCG
jgi:cytochrome P450